jgi:hypothetical protein
MNKHYSVLLLYPDYLAIQYGEETYFIRVTADTPRQAVYLARLEAMVDNPDCQSSEDFAVLLLLEGWVNPIYGWLHDVTGTEAANVTN